MDNFSNLIGSIKGGFKRNSLYIVSKETKHNVKVLDLLIEEGLISGYRRVKGALHVYLKYMNGRSIIKDIKRVSKPGNRVYYKKAVLLKQGVKGDYLFYSTSRGDILSTRGYIKSGGEVLIKINV